ncbi:UPF0481 protein At3g47200 [Setaria viridis]|nr:UPF0481 protein At3g47200-like [Setaria viridis]
MPAPVRAEKKLMMMKKTTVRVDNNELCSSWVVDMEKLLPGTGPSEEAARWGKPSIYRVPEHLKSFTNKSAYMPCLVSLGPFHHGKPELLPMEEHKRRAVLHLVKRSAGKSLRDFVDAVEEMADQLLEAYHGLDEKWRGASRGRFVEMMVMDGCFLLELMKNGREGDYAPNDPVFSAHGNHVLWPGFRSDMIVMENQLPLIVLQRLLAVQCGTTPSAAEINEMVVRYLDYFSCDEGPANDEYFGKLGLHPLEILHRTLCGPRAHHEDRPDSDSSEDSIPVDRSEASFYFKKVNTDRPDSADSSEDSMLSAVEPSEARIHNHSQKKNTDRPKHSSEDSMPSAVELSEARIHFKKCTHVIDDIDFKNGVLSMPVIQAYGDTEKLYLNLLAFEQVHPDIGYQVLSYVAFVVNLIKSERDVALLRSKELIKNFWGSDKELAEMLNTVGKASLMHQTSKLIKVQENVNDHCAKRWNKWRANFVHSYMSNPWVFISLVAAVILLMATLLQTVYTVLPFYKS